VSSVIIGARTEEQLKANLASCQVTLAAEQIAQLDQASALPPEYPGWMLEFSSQDRLALQQR